MQKQSFTGKGKGKGKWKKKGNQEPTEILFWKQTRTNPTKKQLERQQLFVLSKAKQYNEQLTESNNLFTDFSKQNMPIVKDVEEKSMIPTVKVCQENKSSTSKQVSPGTSAPDRHPLTGQIIHLNKPSNLIKPSPSLHPTVSQSTGIPRPTNAEQRMLANTDSPIITLVGGNKKMNKQQKRILRFQMKMLSMQEEKVRQKAIQEVKYENVNEQNPTGTQMTTDTQNPMTVPPSAVPPPTEVQQIGIPNQPQNPPHANIAQPGNVQNATGRSIETLLTTSAPEPRSSKKKNVQPQNTVPPPQPVETVFQVDEQPHSVSRPNKKRRNPRKQQILSNSVNVQTGRPTDNPVDPYGYGYPKGIPRSFFNRNQQQRGAPAGIPKSFLKEMQQLGGTPAGIPISFLLQQNQGTTTGAPDGPIWPSFQINPPIPVQPTLDMSNQLMVETNLQTDLPQPYSPSELYTDLEMPLSPDFEDPEAQGSTQQGQKRLSAFQRLGPQKKPKLTISVTVNDDQAVSREVVDKTEDEEEITPVHFREDIILSDDETVKKYLKSWPWKKNVIVKKSVTVRNSKTVMMLEREQMEEIYNKDTLFVQVTVTGYPKTWKKEEVLDTVMEQIRGYSFIPCFIEFNLQECKFLTLRCRSALLSLHKCGFIVRKNEVTLTITITQTELTLNHLDFVPRLVLRKRLSMCSDEESKLDLSAFTLKEDISHFIYFPLYRLNNQMEVIEMQNDISWKFLTDLNLSHNRIQCLHGFDLETNAPKLKHLNLSYNCLEKITALLKIRTLPLQTIYLEGNPLCRNYIDPDQYVKTVKMMFSSVTTIDGVPVRIKGEMPKFHRNYCPDNAQELAEKFLELYFPILDSEPTSRGRIENMYESTANLTITYSYKMGFSPIYRNFKSLFENSRHLDEGNMDMIKGSKAISKTIASWPHMEHDPLTFTVDVLYHTDLTTIIRVDGILKLTKESLAEDEYLIAFSRTVVLRSRDNAEYKIQTETLYWSLPVGAYAHSAFLNPAVKTKQMYPKIDSTTDEKLQGELLTIFMKVTTMNKTISERCLALKKWNLIEALEHFTKMWELDGLESLTKATS